MLILKASQGNRSLGWDFLPPGSESFEVTDAEGKTWVYAGKQYDECFDAAKEVLAK